ncbi:MAG: hypothetical protein QXU98_09470 [Candidatus Parvarchaeota archaeon]
MPKAQLLNVPQKQNIMLTYSLAASAAAGTSFTFNAYQYGVNTTPNPNIIIPSNEKWFVMNTFVTSAVTPDFVFGIVINGNNQPFQIDANTTIPTNSAAKSLATAANGYAEAIEVPSSATMNVTGFTLAANGSSATSYTAWLEVLRVPL